MKYIPEVESFLNDTEKLGGVSDGEHWFVTEEWAATFREHLKILLELAENDVPQAQYQVGVIYSCGYIYSSEDEALKNSEDDRIKLSYWFERAARGGVYVAIDNLLALGVGKESERLRSLYLENNEKYPLTAAPSKEWEENLKQFSKIAYPNT